MSAPLSSLVCRGCGASPDSSDPYPFRCSNAEVGDVDHVLVRVLAPSGLSFPRDEPGDPCPFVRYRGLLHSAHRAIAGGIGDEAFVALVRQLDAKVAEVDGHGFSTTPFARDAAVSGALGFSPAGGVWVKDETDNVAGSHKARHLMGVLLHLEVAEMLRTANPARRPPLAIASCGNAALAAATLAAAGKRHLTVFVPVDADARIIDRLNELGATVVVCAREADKRGDPTVERLRAELAAGALPFTCQGNLNGLAIEGGETLMYEIVSDLALQGLSIDHLVVQVGGGALASSCAAALEEAVTFGALDHLPRVHTVQTTGAHPLERAYSIFKHDLASCATDHDLTEDIQRAARHRSRYMWPWESEPKSVATGILDDETYDWLAVVRAMTISNGQPVVVDDGLLIEARELGQRAGYHADATGTAGLAGLAQLLAGGVVSRDERVAVLFTGTERGADS